MGLLFVLFLLFYLSLSAVRVNRPSYSPSLQPQSPQLPLPNTAGRVLLSPNYSPQSPQLLTPITPFPFLERTGRVLRLVDRPFEHRRLRIGIRLFDLHVALSGN